MAAAGPDDGWLSGYKPNFTTRLDDLATDLLPGLLGQELRLSQVVWDIDDDSFFADAPVLLQFDTDTLEVCFSKLDQVSLTTDTIDLEITPTWFGGYDFNLEWRNGPDSVFLDVIGRRLSAVRLIEYHFDLSDFAGTSPWVVCGVEFSFGGRLLLVTNGLDENRLENAPLVGADYRCCWEATLG